MQSKAATVAEYIDSLPPDRRTAIETIRNVILKNLDKGIAEGMMYGMIGYYIPHSIYPPGYHCDPKIPLPYAGLASQKQYISLYIGDGCFACDDSKPTEFGAWLRKAWAAAGKKLDMGRCCIRMRSLDDAPLEVIGEAIRRIPLKQAIASYEAARAQAAKEAAKRSAARKAAKPPARKKAAPRKASRSTLAKR